MTWILLIVILNMNTGKSTEIQVPFATEELCQQASWKAIKDQEVFDINTVHTSCFQTRN